MQQVEIPVAAYESAVGFEAEVLSEELRETHDVIRLDDVRFGGWTKPRSFAILVRRSRAEVVADIGKACKDLWPGCGRIGPPRVELMPGSGLRLLN